ncbi:MAG: FAD-dependent oxidoreductase, partial [Candidatus Omnitrophica bacterium]|nr:FAD-dependent oxidoreductase [Candidatus Omnitrophota bacterium]
RVPKPPALDIVKASMGIKTEGYLHQLHYFYPKEGGIQSLIERLAAAKAGPITTAFRVGGVTREGGQWKVTNGSESRIFDRIVSTMPVFDLIRAMDRVPKEVQEALSRLKYNSMIVVMLGLDTDRLPDYTAMYFPGKETPYHRVCFMSSFSPANAPKGKSSIVAEITAGQNDATRDLEDEELINIVTDSLDKEKIINKHSVVYRKACRIKHAYVIYDLEYKKNLSVVKNFIASSGIELLGRFAEFEYINMDEVINRSMKLAQRLNAS